MTDPVTVPQTPPLVRLANIELMHTGTWEVSTGIATFTTDDLTDAVAALGCSAVRRPVLKIGHNDPRFDGEPCVGWVDNLAVADNGRTLIGDFVGMPGWLGEVLASAYPDRSCEGQYDHRCQMGHVHPFVVSAVALLGVTAPGIGTLESLQDVATLYGVVAAGERSVTGTPITVVVKGSSVPRQVTASVSSEDVMRAFYGSELGSGWDAWVEELQLDPFQLIYVNDADSSRSRVPVTIGSGEGVDAVTFGDPVPVIIRYVDASVAGPLDNRDVVKCSYRSRPSKDQRASGAPEEGNAMDDAQLTAMRTALGLAADADEVAVTAAMVERITSPPPPEPPGPSNDDSSPPSQLPEGVVTIDQAQLTELVAAAARGEEARARQEREDRERLVAAAIRDGRIAPVRREHWLTGLEKDPGSADVLASLAPGLIPVGPEIGHSGGTESADDVLYAKLWGAPAEASNS